MVKKHNITNYNAHLLKVYLLDILITLFVFDVDCEQMYIIMAQYSHRHLCICGRLCTVEYGTVFTQEPMY